MTVVPIVMMRGGTSRAVFLREKDALSGGERDALLLRLLGSPDPRQIDGLGGADLLTSKIAIIGSPTVEDADIDYTFVQVGIDQPFVDYTVNCGNISAAVALYAIQEGFVRSAGGDECAVRIHNTNTGKVIVGSVPMDGQHPSETGDTHIDGVPGVGPGIFLDYHATDGALTGRILPTGATCDRIEVPSLGPIDFSLVDVANLIAYVRADSLGFTDDVDLDAALGRQESLELLERVRGSIAARCGFASSWETARSESPMTPLLSVVAPPQNYHALTDGRRIVRGDVDVLARMYAGGSLHKSYAGTGLANIGVAAAIGGSLVAEASSTDVRETGLLRVGHPCGIGEVVCDVAGTPDEIQIRKVGYLRTARRLLVGEAFV